MKSVHNIHIQNLFGHVRTPSSFLPSNKNKNNNFETQWLDWKGRAIVDDGLKRFTSGLELKYLEITADIFSCSFLLLLFSLQNKTLKLICQQGIKSVGLGNERLDWGTLKPEVVHNTDMRTVHILIKVNAVVHFTVFLFFFRFLFHSLGSRKINASLQNNMAVSHWGKKKRTYLFCFFNQ